MNQDKSLKPLCGRCKSFTNPTWLAAMHAFIGLCRYTGESKYQHHQCSVNAFEAHRLGPLDQENNKGISSIPDGDDLGLLKRQTGPLASGLARTSDQSYLLKENQRLAAAAKRLLERELKNIEFVSDVFPGITMSTSVCPMTGMKGSKGNNLVRVEVAFIRESDGAFMIPEHYAACPQGDSVFSYVDGSMYFDLLSIFLTRSLPTDSHIFDFVISPDWKTFAERNVEGEKPSEARDSK